MRLSEKIVSTFGCIAILTLILCAIADLVFGTHKAVWVAMGGAGLFGASVAVHILIDVWAKDKEKP